MSTEHHPSALILWVWINGGSVHKGLLYVLKKVATTGRALPSSNNLVDLVLADFSLAPVD
jgi:hypothetical protein